MISNVVEEEVLTKLIDMTKESESFSCVSEIIEPVGVSVKLGRIITLKVMDISGRGFAMIIGGILRKDKVRFKRINADNRISIRKHRCFEELQLPPIFADILEALANLGSFSVLRNGKVFNSVGQLLTLKANCYNLKV